MSGPCLPAEVSDYIVDLLHDQPKTLGRCCLVSKSWVPRARKHLFAQIAFRSACDLDAWKETFPDSSNSPAHYARSLYFGKIHGIDSIITEDDCWTRAFCNVVKLELEDVCSAVPLPHLQILTLICSLPHLEDLILVNFEVANEPGDGTVPQPPSSPPFTGTLEIDRPQRVGCLLHRLLSLPNGLRFRQLRCAWDVEDGFRRTISLLDACSNTLERVDLDSSPTFGDSTADLISFSKSKTLRSVVLRLDGSFVEWVAATLGTITSEHRYLQEVTIYLSFHYVHFYPFGSPHIRAMIGERAYRHWLHIDNLLDQLSESGDVCVTVWYRQTDVWKETVKDVGNLLPGMARRGNIKTTD